MIGSKLGFRVWASVTPDDLLVIQAVHVSTSQNNNQACHRNKTSSGVCKSRLQHSKRKSHRLPISELPGSRFQSSNPQLSKAKFQKTFTASISQMEKVMLVNVWCCTIMHLPTFQSSTHANATFLKCMDGGLLLVPELCTRCTVQSRNGNRWPNPHARMACI
jgi:hypothetical protein